MELKIRAVIFVIAAMGELVYVIYKLAKVSKRELAES